MIQFIKTGRRSARPMLFLGVLIFSVFLYLLLFPEAALEGARSGLLLWYRSVLPVLFPFMILCGIIIRLGLAGQLLKLLFRPFHFLFGCSAYGSFAVMTGFLCGFPMGAKITADLYRQKKINSREAEHLFGFVNNLSPGFLLSYLAADQMNFSKGRFLFLFNVLGAAVLWGILTGQKNKRADCFYLYSDEKADPFSLEQGKDKTEGREINSPGCLTDIWKQIDISIQDSITNITKLGAYILLFSVLSKGISSLLPLQNPLFLIFASSIEVTGGIRLIATSDLPFSWRYILACAVSAFGGISALMQTISLTSMTGGQILRYIKSRVMITLLSILIAASTLLIIPRLPLP